MDLNSEQAKVLEEMESGKNIFLTGSAGTGKTYIIQEFIRRHEKEVLVCASTGIASHVIGGTTVHRAFNITSEVCPHVGNKYCEALEGTHTVIIDEISMLRRDIFEYVAAHILKMEKKTGRRIQVIACGDFLQLPPVIKKDIRAVLEEYYGSKRSGFYAFQSPYWDKLGFENIQLTQIVRQRSGHFTELLSQVRVGQLSAVEQIFSMAKQNEYDANAITICGKNDQVDMFNNTRLAEIKATAYEFDAEMQGDVRPEEIVCAERLVIKEGCRVMLIANLNGSNVNGMMGTVLSVNHKDPSKERIRVKWDDGHTSSVPRYTWTINRYAAKYDGEDSLVERVEVGRITQFPLKVAYAMTVHKAQGQTFDKINLVLGNTFSYGQLYVALSRVKSIYGIYIGQGLMVQKLADPEVLAFYKQAEFITFLVEEKKKKKESRGRKSTWNGQPTTLIRVPVCLKDALMEIAHRMLLEQVE